MKKTICVLFCFTVVLCIFPATVFAEDFSDNAIKVFQELRKLDEESRAAFLSGDMNFQKEKGQLLSDTQDKFNNILKSLPHEYCANPKEELLKEFIKTLIGITDEYPTYVFAELYACNPDSVKKEILSLSPDDQKKICENLDWGFKNITYKIESLPNYKELKEKLADLKRIVKRR